MEPIEIGVIAVTSVMGLVHIIGAVRSIDSGMSTIMVGRRFRFRHVLLTGTASHIYAILRALTGLAYVISVIAYWMDVIEVEIVFFVLVIPIFLYRIFSSIASFFD